MDCPNHSEHSRIELEVRDCMGREEERERQRDGETERRRDGERERERERDGEKERAREKERRRAHERDSAYHSLLQHV